MVPKHNGTFCHSWSFALLRFLAFDLVKMFFCLKDLGRELVTAYRSKNMDYSHVGIGRHLSIISQFQGLISCAAFWEGSCWIKTNDDLSKKVCCISLVLLREFFCLTIVFWSNQIQTLHFKA